MIHWGSTVSRMTLYPDLLKHAQLTASGFLDKINHDLALVITSSSKIRGHWLSYTASSLDFRDEIIICISCPEECSVYLLLDKKKSELQELKAFEYD